MADQADFPSIYIDGSSGGDGSEASPYSDLSDINWTTGGDNSIYDYLDGTPSESPTIYLAKGGTWRETLTTDCDGTATYPIVVTSYGTGANPIITAADLRATWVTTINDWDLSPTFSINPSGDYNIRCLIPATSVGANGAQIRVKLGTHDNESVLDEIFIGQQASAGDAFDMESGTITEVLFGGTSGVTISSGDGSEWSDWLTYSFDDSKAHFISVGGTGDWGRMGAGQTLYYDSGGAAAAGTANVAGYSTVDMVWTFMAIEVRTVADAGANTWQTACTTEPNIALFDGTVGTKAANMAALNAANEWWWDSNVMYVYSTSDPDMAYTSPGIESGARDTSITVHNEYITFENLHCYGSNDATGAGIVGNGVAGGGSTTFTSCTVEKNLNHGVYLLNSGNHTFTTCDISDNLDHGLLFVESSDSYDVTGITITGGTYNNNVTNGIYFFGTNATTQKITSGGTVSGITATGNGAGVYLTKADGVTITGCTLHTNTNEDGSGEGYGIGCQSGSSNIIYANTIYDNRTRAIEFWGESGAQSDSNKFYRNNVYGSGDYGIHFSAEYCDNNEVYYNLVHSNTTTGIYMGHNAANEGNVIYNNVLYNNGTYDMDFDAGADGYTVKNNIFYTTGTYGLLATATTAVTHSNNCFYKASGNVISYNGTTYTMATATNFEATCVNEDPLMTDPANGDFTLQTTSPCIGVGTVVYVDNVVENPSFEDDDDWVDYGTDPTHAQGSGYVHTGSYDWEITTGAVDSGIQADTDVYGTVTTGETYEVSIWLYCVGGDITATYGITDDGTGVLSTTSATEDLTNGEWSHGTFTALCTTTGTVRPFVSINGSEWIFAVDDFTIKKRASLDYAGNLVTPLPNIGAYEDFPGAFGGGQLRPTMGMYLS